MTVLIAGAGIAGLSLGLTLHQIGVPFRIFEAVREMRPLGVGINLQPNAVRELLDLDLGAALDDIGIPIKDYGFYSKRGLEIWTEKRGREAGYHWPQYAVHRGALQMRLASELRARAGENCIVTNAPAAGFKNTDQGAALVLQNGEEIHGDLVIAADGIHSALRAQMYPNEGPAIWGGAILWRGTTQAKPFLNGASMALAGHDTQRIVAYPITPADPQTGQATINWIAELRVDPAQGWRKEDWNRAAQLDDFLPKFEDWTFDWLNVPELIKGAKQVFEYPMVDRDPVDQWTDGRVTLMGDAAHPTYPVGSNGASQAIVDARILGQMFLSHGVNQAALLAYEDLIRPRTRNVILANRGSGPDAVMQKVEDLCGGQFETIDDVIPYADLKAHADHYKVLAGFDVETLNATPQLIERGARIG
ncbi:flavin-dependent oxidoreductase [Planktotalea sp.]|uniref:flavin-dependent oxidoreductase n=1 Tax=Planktotalea sp. TaxID=2029877 RepID=UPI00329A031F